MSDELYSFKGSFKEAKQLKKLKKLKEAKKAKAKSKSGSKPVLPK